MQDVTEKAFKIYWTILTVESSTCVNDDSPKRKATFAQGSPAAEDALRVRVKAESDNDPMPPLPTLPTL